MINYNFWFCSIGDIQQPVMYIGCILSILLIYAWQSFFLNSNLTNSTKWWNFRFINLRNMCRRYNDVFVINRFFMIIILIVYFLIGWKGEKKNKFKVNKIASTKHNSLSFYNKYYSCTNKTKKTWHQFI